MIRALESAAQGEFFFQPEGVESGGSEGFQSVLRLLIQQFLDSGFRRCDGNLDFLRVRQGCSRVK